MKYLLLVAIIAMPFFSNAQSITPTVLKVGDPFPDHAFTNLINYPKPSLKLSDFRGKLVLFDLWSTGCPGCINSWPKLLKLQKEFAGQIQIILVNPYQTKKTITDIYEKRKRLAGIDVNLPTIYNDSLILKLIPAVTVPHVLWIDEKGVIRSITQGDLVNEKNLGVAVKEGKFNLPQKNFAYGKFADPTLPLYVNENPGLAPQTIWQSIVTIADPSVQRNQVVGCDKDVCFAQATNSSITELYQIAYGTRLWYPERRLLMVPYNRIVLEVPNPDKYTYYINQDEINYSNFYNYSLLVPSMDVSSVQKLMQQDLERYFGLAARWERRKVPSYVIRSSDTTAIAYQSGPKEFTVTSSEFRINKLNMDEIINWLEYGTDYVDMPYPVFDETGYKGLVGGIVEEVDSSDPEKLNKVLSKYKLSFTREMREADFLVLTKK